MKPYYQDDLVTLYHGDCREIDDWRTADVLVTDPPYGTDTRLDFGRGGRYGDSPWAYDIIDGDGSTDVRDAVLTMWGDGPGLVFGSWKQPPPDSARFALVWDKGMACGMGDLAIPWKHNWELIYGIGTGFSGNRDSGIISGYSVVTWASRGRSHPHQKPIGLRHVLLEKCPSGTVADPFAGSGSTLRAAKDRGMRAIGVEIDERYCETAVTRLAQGVLDLG